MLGNNYGANQEVFEDGLREIVEELAPRPTLLFSVTLFEENRAEVNEAVYDIATDFDNVRVVDWAGETTDDASLLGGDGLHLSDLGRERLVELIVQELGEAPGGDDDGDCLGSDFTDDSATSPTGTTLPGQAPYPGTGNGNGSGTGNGSGSGSGNGTGTTSPPATNPPVDTNPPATDPPSTSPPATDPPATNPPATDPPATNPPATSPPATNPPAPPGTG